MELEKLVQEAKRGNPEAFGQLYDCLAERLFRYIKLKVGGHQATAEDLLQEVFVKSWQALSKFDETEGNFNAWMYCIATNAVRDHFRKVYRRPQTVELLDTTEVSSEDMPGEILTRQQEIERVKEALVDLPPQYQQVIELRFIQDFTVQETAEILGKNNLSVRVLQHRALKKLQQLIGTRSHVQYSKVR